MIKYKKLYRSDVPEPLIQNLIEAKKLFPRMKGLLGKKQLNADEGLWIHNCNSIHTFFMKFSIDCIFIDKNFKVIDYVKNIPPFRIILPRWRAHSVIEIQSPYKFQDLIKNGDQLYVGN